MQAQPGFLEREPGFYTPTTVPDCRKESPGNIVRSRREIIPRRKMASPASYIRNNRFVLLP
ncbi:hypothetical protein EAJ17_12650 [Akkermansia sp. aa_0143]|nr:hypothetical protein EAJ17_12650 [Akkermansia sp. aa_0143]